MIDFKAVDPVAIRVDTMRPLMPCYAMLCHAITHPRTDNRILGISCQEEV